MDGSDPISDLGLGCPFNGTFYICKDSPTRFIGCCTSNPCGDRKGLCPDEHLEPATFEARYRIPPQACINDNFAVSWYTCPDTSPPFLGCCAVDPCSRRGCPDRELRAAKLSDKKSDADLFTGGSSPGSDLKGNPSAKVSITTAMLTTSYMSTKTIEAGAKATSTIDSASPASHPSGGKKKLSPGGLAGVILGVAAAFFLVGVIFACIYSRHNKRRFRTTNENQSSSRLSIALSSMYSSRRGPISAHGSLYGLEHEGRMTGIQAPSRIPSGQDPGQGIHEGASSGGQHLQQQSQEGWTQQPQSIQDALSMPNSRVPRNPVQGPNTDQTSMPYPSTPQPPYPPSIINQNEWDWENRSQLDPHSYNPWTELPANAETPLSINPPSTPVDQPQLPIAELPANAEKPLSTGRRSTPIFRIILDEIDCRWHEPSPGHPESSPRPPITRPSTAPPSGISEEQSADDIDSSNTVATRLERQLNHDQSGSRGEHQDVTSSGQDSRPELGP